MSAETVLRSWRERFAEADQCPWPGPRPLVSSRDESHLLIGREDDRSRFRQEVDRHRLVILTGDSGVGKTSLIEAGLVPELRDAGGYTVALCRDWSGGADESDPVAFLSTKVAQALRDGNDDRSYSTGAALFWEVERAEAEDGVSNQRKVVLILDQFEELIRDAPTLIDALFQLLAELNQRTKINLVISLRSEYRSALRPLENQALPFTIAHFHLEAVDPSFAAEIVLAGNHGDSKAVDEEAATVIADAWTTAFGKESGSGRLNRFGKIGLLHLQALLYALHGNVSGGLVQASDVEELVEKDPVRVFSEGLQRAIDLKLERCRAACEALQLDDYLVEGTAGYVARSVSHLSSVGYKLVRGVHDLWTATMGNELEVLPPDHEDLLLGVVNTILPAGSGNLIQSTRRALAREGGDSWASRVQREEVASPGRGWIDAINDDPREMSCGPLMGLPPEAVLVEELRRFAFALEWLQTSSLIRISTPGQDGAMISLIHDGFGAALERWSEHARGRPITALKAITAPKGASYGWQFDGNEVPDHEELDGTRSSGLIPNLRWKGSWVRASFRGLQFVNCDLRGVFFDQCSFRGVSFVNCLLDGAVFSDCTIHGRPKPAREGYSTTAPQFVIDAPVGLLRSLASCREIPIAPSLISPWPGLPAIPTDVPEVSQPWTPETDGLAIFGGRVSSLVVRGTRYVDDGQLVLRQVAGSGFDLVEQESGDIEVTGSRLRHLTVTRPARPMEDAGSSTADVRLRVAGSMIAQAWFGDDLVGTLEFDDCTLIQVWNGSPSLGATATNSSHFDLVNVTIGDGCAPVDPLGSPSPLEVADPPRLDGNPGIRERAREMDYRRNPAAAALAAAEQTD